MVLIGSTDLMIWICSLLNKQIIDCFIAETRGPRKRIFSQISKALKKGFNH